MEAKTVPQVGSPHKATVRGFQPFSATELDLLVRRFRLCVEMSGRFIGEVPANAFIEYFLPRMETIGDRAVPQANFERVPQGAGKENAMYKPFVCSQSDFVLSSSY